MRRHCPLLTLALVSIALPAFAADEKRPITHDALWRLKSVGAPVPSPDGKWVVVSVGEPAYDEKDEVSDLWIVPADGSAPPRRLTSTKGGENGAAWSPDSRRIALAARREGDEAAQIYLLDLGGGEAQRLTTLTLGARGPKWSPDGTTIAFQSTVWRGATDEAANKKLNDERKAAKTKVRVYDGFPIRSWDRWLDDRQTHLFVVPVDNGSRAKDLLAGTTFVEARGFRGGDGGDDLAPAWAPDGTSILITASVDGDTAAYAEPTTQL